MFHIISAVVLIAVSTTMIGAALVRRDIKGIRGVSATGLVVTLLSGVGLIFLGASLGHFCVSMTLVTAANFAARSFYLARVPSLG